MKKKPARHGDVLLRPVDSIPEGAKKVSHRTLAEGEVTGHAHRIALEDQPFTEMYEKDGVFYLQVNKKEGVTLTHEEHKKGVIPEGISKIEIQEDYTPEGWRRVAD